MTERLTEKFKDGRNILRKGIDNIHHDGFGQFYSGEAIDKLAKYEIAEEEGRLLILPCKAGDTVWTFYDDMSGAFCFTVEEVQIVFDGRSKPYFLIDNMDFEIDCIGKTLFFTHEEAEKALTKMNGGQPSAQ